MTAKESKHSNWPASGHRGANDPYDPLDLRTLAESMAKVVLDQHVYPLAGLSAFEGAGVYVIYYTGSYEPYKSIAQRNKGRKWDQPIYVGEAARKEAERAESCSKDRRAEFSTAD